MKDSSKNPSQNTELFSSLPDAVAVIINDVIHAIYSILCWRQASKSLLTEILSRLAETESFEQSHDDFCAGLWSHLNVERRREKFSRWLTALKSDMELSHFEAVHIPKQKVTRSEGGGYKGHLTIYYRGKFWDLFKCVQFVARKCDLLSMPVRKRRAEVRAIVFNALSEMNAVKIERVKIEEKIKPARPSLSCNCACASCQSCAAKSATGSEATARPAQERITKSSVTLRMSNALEELYECGSSWANLDLDVKEYWVKVATELNILDQRLADAMKRHNAPKVKVNGVQPK